MRPFFFDRSQMFPATPLNRLKLIENSLAAVLLSMVWLVPNHQLPWTTFHHELVAALALGSMFLLLVWQARQGAQMPLAAALLFLLATIPWLQWGAGLLPKFGIAFVSSMYIAATGAAVVLGFSARGAAAGRLMDIFTAALIVAVLGNLPIQLIQWFQWYSDDITSIQSMLVTPIGRESRPSGSLLQPNLLATLQVWALLGLTWWRVERRLPGLVFTAGFALVLIGLGLTQSRAGMLEMALCAAVLGFFARRWVGLGVCAAWVLMLAVLIVWSLNFQHVAEWLGVKGAAEGRLSAIDGARIDAWRAFGLAVLDSPWWGYGVSDVGYPYFLHADSHPQIYIGQRFGHAHNLLLDMALWVGIPLTLLLTLTAAVWGWRRLEDARQQPALFIPLLVIATLMVHAMLELPHHHLYMLMPAGICIGVVCRVTNARSVLQLGGSGALAVGLCICTVAGSVAWDYFPYQERYTEWRFDNLGIGYRLDRPIKPPLLLDQLHDELVLYRIDYSQPIPPDRLDWLDETARAVTTAPAIYYTARAFVIAGRLEEALVWMRRFNAITPPDMVDQTRAIWARDQGKYPQLRSLDWPPYAGRTSTFRFEAEPTSGP